MKQIDIDTFKDDLELKIKELEKQEDELLEKDEDLTPQQKHQLGVLHFQYGEICRLLGKKKEAETNKRFSQNYLAEARQESLNDPAYIREERLMYELIGEPLPEDLQAAIREQAAKEGEAKKGKGFVRRLLGGLFDSGPENSANLEGDLIEDVFTNVDILERALALKDDKGQLYSKRYHEDLARAFERGLIKGMVLAGYEDWEIECGVEGEYLESILSNDEIRDLKEVKRRIESGEIDMSQMPAEFRQFDFGERIEVDEGFEEQVRLNHLKLGYLEKRIAKTEEGSKERETLEYLRKQVESILFLGEVGYENPELLIKMGAAQKVSGPTDIGTADERKAFYFVNAMTRALKPYIPSLGARMNGSMGPEDVYSGWNLLKEKFPLLQEVEDVGIANMAKALRSLGYKDTQTAVRALINTTEGGLHVENIGGALRVMKRAVDGVKKIGYDIKGEVSR